MCLWYNMVGLLLQLSLLALGRLPLLCRLWVSLHKFARHCPAQQSFTTGHRNKYLLASKLGVPDTCEHVSQVLVHHKQQLAVCLDLRTGSINLCTLTLV